MGPETEKVIIIQDLADEPGNFIIIPLDTEPPVRSLAIFPDYDDSSDTTWNPFVDYDN